MPHNVDMNVKPHRSWHCNREYCGGTTEHPCIIALGHQTRTIKILDDLQQQIVEDRHIATFERYPPVPMPIPGPGMLRESYSERVALYILIVVTWVVTLLTAYLVGAS